MTASAKYYRLRIFMVKKNPCKAKNYWPISIIFIVTTTAERPGTDDLDTSKLILLFFTVYYRSEWISG